MKTKTREELFAECVNKAMRHVEDKYDCIPEMRKWLTATAYPYDVADYRVEAHVLEGSPHKGCVFADRDTGFVWAFGPGMRDMRRFRAY